MNHFIYVIAASTEGPVKIGISNDPDARVLQLQTGHPQQLIVFHREPIESTKVKTFETLVHRHIRHNRSKGEWFNLTVAEAILQIQWTIIHYDGVEDIVNKVRTKHV